MKKTFFWRSLLCFHLSYSSPWFACICELALSIKLRQWCRCRASALERKAVKSVQMLATADAGATKTAETRSHSPDWWNRSSVWRGSITLPSTHARLVKRAAAVYDDENHSAPYKSWRLCAAPRRTAAGSRHVCRNRLGGPAYVAVMGDLARRMRRRPPPRATVSRRHLVLTANFFSVLITTFSDTRAASNFGGSKLLYQTTTKGVSRDHL